MSNNLGRKTTSLTLMIIMLAGGMTVAVPGFAPVAFSDSDSALYVSAEKTGSYIDGVQIVEVILTHDSIIDDNDDDDGATITPDVTINGDALLMTEAMDGNHYAYFASYSDIQAVRDANAADPTSNPGLDFGSECRNLSNQGAKATLCNVDGVVKSSISAKSTDSWPFIQLYEFSDTMIEIQYNKASGVETATTLFFGTSLDTGMTVDRDTYPTGAEIHAVITDHRLNIDPTSADAWTWDVTGTSMYYGLNNAITDKNGNIHNSAISNSMVDSDLVCDGCSIIIDFNAQGAQPDIIENVASGDRPVNPTQDGSDYINERWVSIHEIDGTNTGIFTTTDENEDSAIQVTSDAQANTSAIISYDGALTSILVRHATPTISIESPTGPWTSGLSIPITIVDENANKNSRLDERISIHDIHSIIPTLVTGDPYNLAHSNTTTWIGYRISLPNDEVVRLANTKNDPTSHDDAKLNLNNDPATDPFSLRLTDTHAFLGFRNTAEVAPSGDVLFLTFHDDFDDRLQSSIEALSLTPDSPFLAGFPFLILDLDFTDLKDVFINNAADSQSGFNMLNYDISSLGGDDVSLDKLQININRVRTAVVDVGSPSGHIQLPDEFTTAIFDGTATGRVQLILHVSGMDVVSGTQYPVIIDFFNFGLKSNDDDGTSTEIISNQIIRLELEESSENQGTFEGTLQYVIADPLGISNPGISSAISPVSNNAKFIMIEDLTGDSTLQVTYQDLSADLPDTPTGQPADSQITPSNLRTVDSSGNPHDALRVDKQIHITADLLNNQDADQVFTYLVQVQDSDSTTVSLSWISGVLPDVSSFSPAVSWVPHDAGTYTVTVFVWDSIENPTILSPSISIDVDVI